MNQLNELLAQLEKDLIEQQEAENKAKESIKSISSQIKKVKKLIAEWK